MVKLSLLIINFTILLFRKGQNTPRGNQSSRMSQQDKPSYYRTRYVSTTSQHYMLPVDGQARNTRNIHTKINPTNQNEFK